MNIFKIILLIIIILPALAFMFWVVLDCIKFVRLCRWAFNGKISIDQFVMDVEANGGGRIGVGHKLWKNYKKYKK
jgi:hypothetical protein